MTPTDPWLQAPDAFGRQTRQNGGGKHRSMLLDLSLNRVTHHAILRRAVHAKS